MDDYYAVLSSCIQDIENEKVSLYSELMKGLIEGNFNSETRRHFIKSCKDLTFAELIFLRDIYINSEYEMMPLSGCVTGVNTQVKNILTTNDPLRRITIEKLISLGFINNQPNEITSLGRKFIPILFSNELLTPESIGRRRFTGHHVLIVNYNIGNPVNDKLAFRLLDCFIQKNVQPSIGVLRENCFGISAAVVLIDNNLIEQEYINSLIKFSKLIPMALLNINETSDNRLEGVRFMSKLSLSKDVEATIDKTVDSILELLTKINYSKDQ
ncbi:hypothetical protein [Methylomonas koyamae]|nr:hypothetical protein [Methylomonas koyamae]BBL57420.1 hypothetical protein MKFW12EY_10330 [Methylomonas koyamae]